MIFLRTTLIRTTLKGNTRYYELTIQKTLFDGFLVERIYGNIAYKSHTGLKINYFENEKEAKHFFNTILRKKQKKGYR